MTTHELAKVLLTQENVPVIINGWGSDEGFAKEVGVIETASNLIFDGTNDNVETPRNVKGYPTPRRGIVLSY